MLNATDLQTYTAQQVASLADVDVYAVRSEGERRQAAAAKKEMADGETIILAAWEQIERERAAA